MSAFSINVTKRILIANVGLSGDQMQTLGVSLMEAMKARWAQGLDVNDRPAAPLSRSYANRKVRLGAKPIPDLKLSGELINSFGVLSNEPGKCVVGTRDPVAIVKAVANKQQRNQIGISPRDASIVSPIAAAMVRENILSAISTRKSA